MKDLSVVYGRDYGSNKDRDHLDVLIGDRPITVWYSVAYDLDNGVEQNMCAQLRSMAEALSKNIGLLIVDL